VLSPPRERPSPSPLTASASSVAARAPFSGSSGVLVSRYYRGVDTNHPLHLAHRVVPDDHLG
jgi:hypothetical protein